MTKAFKVVGIQIVSKSESNNKNIVNQVAWNGIRNCRKVFENLVSPVNKKRCSDKQRNNQTFSVVGVMNVQQGKNEALFDMNISGYSKGLGKDVKQQFQDLIKTVN